MRRAPKLSPKRVILVNLSGRGDKDLESVRAWDEKVEAAASAPAAIGVAAEEEE